MDPNGKLTVTLSYGKLLSRSHKISYTLLNKIGLNNKTGELQVISVYITAFDFMGRTAFYFKTLEAG